jgi:hypothetical protein
MDRRGSRLQEVGRLPAFRAGPRGPHPRVEGPMRPTLKWPKDRRSRPFAEEQAEDEDGHSNADVHGAHLANERRAWPSRRLALGSTRLRHALNRGGGPQQLVNLGNSKAHRS